LCAASSKADQALIAEVFAESGREHFAASWLRRRGLDWAAELLGEAPNLFHPPLSISRAKELAV